MYTHIYTCANHRYLHAEPCAYSVEQAQRCTSHRELFSLARTEEGEKGYIYAREKEREAETSRRRGLARYAALFETVGTHVAPRA